MAGRLSEKLRKLCAVAAPLVLAGAPASASAGDSLLAAPRFADNLSGKSNVVLVNLYRPGCGCPCPCGPSSSGAPATDQGASPSDSMSPEGTQPLESANLGDEQFAGLGSDSFSINDAPGGYIDNPIVGTWFRLRYDDANNAPTPDRAEFMYGAYGGVLGNITGPGPVSPTGITPSRVDLRYITAYGEVLLLPRLSVFAEIQEVFNDINFPDGGGGADTISSNQGFGDSNTGFKYALYTDPCRYLTFQFKIYIPTGSARHGTGTGHVSYEPGLLYLRRIGDRAYFQGEARYWIPDGGTPGFQGDVFRWGAGVGYDLINTGSASDPLNPYYSSGRRLTAVTEFVGWSVRNGQVTIPDSAIIGPGSSVSARADIVNLKLGLRATVGDRSVYVGWGHAMTGDKWYQDLLRVEYRRMF